VSMAYYTFKALNSALWVTTTLWSWGKWVVYGVPESPELQLAKHNKERLDRMETKIDQIWAIERGLPKITDLNDSFILIESTDDINKTPIKNNINCHLDQLP